MMYFLVKFIHISAAIIWIGSIFMMSILHIRLARAQSKDALIAIGNQGEFLGKTVIAPSGGITLLAGIALSTFFGFGWPLWVIWGFTVILLASILGGNIGTKIGKQMSEVVASSNIDTTKLEKIRRHYTLISSVVILLLLSAVWAMVFKPIF